MARGFTTARYDSTPPSSSRRSRSAAAGADSPTRRASSATRSRGSACSSATIRRSRSSSGSGDAKADGPEIRCFSVDCILPPVGTPFTGEAPGPYAPVMPRTAQAPPARAAAPPGRQPGLPPQAYFLVSAIFHYLGPALAVLLFTRIGVLGVAWLRIASAALIFALWR